MPKEMGDNSVSNVRYWEHGVFTERIKIISVTDKSNYPLQKNVPKNTVGKNAFQPELCLEVKYDSGTGVKEKLIFGQFDWDVDKVSGKKIKYKGWKQKGNPVQALIYALIGKFMINDDDSIMPSTLKKLEGYEYVTLRYCIGSQKDSDKPGFKDFNMFMKYSDTAEQELFDKFYAKSAKISKYDPNYFEDHNDRNSGFNPSAYSSENNADTESTHNDNEEIF